MDEWLSLRDPEWRGKHCEPRYAPQINTNW